MTRAERINKEAAAFAVAEKGKYQWFNIGSLAKGFVKGAEWSDEHPTEEVQRLKEMFKGDPDAYKQGRKDATNNPTGEELLHVLEKGRKIGFQDAVDKAFKWLIERYENQGVVLIDDIHELRDCMEEQQ